MRLDNDLVTSTTGNYNFSRILQFADNIYNLLLSLFDVFQAELCPAHRL